MQIGYSNLAWDVSEDSAIADLFVQKGITSVDLIPTKYFPDVYKVTEAEVLAVKKWWADRGIRINGMQSLLFGKSEYGIFNGASDRQQLLAHLQKIAWLASLWEAPKLVFGSPKNRDRKDLDDQAVNDIAAQFFGALAKIGQKNQVIFCLEPNPKIYQCNFMINSLDTLEVVKMIDHPHIRMQLDTGALYANNEVSENIVKKTLPYIGHIHLSEPHLKWVGFADSDQKAMSHLVKNCTTTGIATVEMLPTKEVSHLESISKTLDQLIPLYT